MYSKENIIDIIESILKIKVVKIIPIGHHELNRHCVYIVYFEKLNPIVFKIFCVKNRINREIASLNLLKYTNVKSPKFFIHGILNDGNEWMIYDYIDGVSLDSILERLSQNELNTLFIQVGEELGKIHAVKKFDFYGNWDASGNSINNIKSYYEYFIRSVEMQICELILQEFDDKRFLLDVADKIRKNYSLIKAINESRLCHNDFDGRNILVLCQKDQCNVNGIVDFEQSFPGNKEMDIARLYFRYFLENLELEKSFFKGYNKWGIINIVVLIQFFLKD
ncbi:Phosphotransferase enzyme family protein [Caloramator mitchellensis]|uniref:Phosphotransferase enzyme family protein n=1 Tax=Caloramator mitchellensis TaxID=908809 RepID=A0A0R3JYG0_CALMK|nr:Phosphotransferase enzyme family protein [Caloramator mitchellensis]